MGKYKDIRQDFWREAFDAAKPYDAYLEAGDPAHSAKWRSLEPNVVLPDSARTVVEGFTRRINVLVYSGVWCGDCVRQGPILKAIADANPQIDLRFSEREDGSALGEELHINGAAKVPVAVFLSEDFFEVARFGDRMLSVYRRMAEAQLGPSCSTGLIVPKSEELAEEAAEWVDLFERVHIILRLAPMLRERYGD